jgi:2-keto-4-pentenoate hydratase
MMDERIRRGMHAQLAVRRHRITAGEQQLGWKVGFGAPSAMTALDIDRPLVGYLMKSTIVASGAEIPYADFTQAVIEPEIAVYLDRGVDGGAEKAAIRAAISGLGAAIEIADVSFPPTVGPEKILAGNIYQKGIVLGQVDECRAGAELNQLTAAVSFNGNDVAIPEDLESNTGPIVDIVALVADTLAAMGERLAAGELIIVGSIVPPFFLDAAATITYTLGDAEAISIKVI